MASRHQISSGSDAELLRMALGGHETAFLVLYQRLKNGIFRYAFYMTSSRSTAEEITQEVFIALLREGRKYRPDRGDLAAFAFGIARNVVRRTKRRERAYEPIPGDQALERLSGNLISASESLAGQIIRKDLALRVHGAVASLPDHYRQVVVLCDLLELSYAEAASRLECAIGTVRSRLNRAHALLAQKLEPLRSAHGSIAAAGPEGCII
jgi:RNA polymerase sigma-70 factor, ECF subfamily